MCGCLEARSPGWRAGLLSESSPPLHPLGGESALQESGEFIPSVPTARAPPRTSLWFQRPGAKLTHSNSWSPSSQASGPALRGGSTRSH